MNEASTVAYALDKMAGERKRACANPAMAYTFRQVLENTIRSGSPVPESAVFLRPDFPSMGGVRLSVRLAARLRTRFQHPAHPHCLKTVAVAFQSHVGASAMATIAHSARSRTSISTESTSIQFIAADALRAAALAPTYQDALDVAGDALRRVVEIARTEVSNA
ncbi:hypothetical protein [Paraburkholderia sp. GAS348]|uniref:hypothetical protein n=1 Tax=Paraburkholderia sp. GAS348 TaxID=3035132 RepID=UPI003D2091D0